MDDAIPDYVISAVMKRECILFVGAGMSIDAGLPSSRKLAEKLFSIIEKDGYARPDDFTLPRIAEDFKNKCSRNELEEILREEIINSMEDCDTTSYDLLAKLKPLPEVIITTNYDRLLENSLGSQNYIPIFNEHAVSKYKSPQTNLFKIHGDVNSLEEAVITVEDISKYEETHLAIWNKIKALFQERPVIFIGFSMEDEHIRNIYKEIKEHLGEHMPLAYAVSPSDANQLRLEEIGVKHIETNAREFLEKILQQLDEKGYTTLPFEIPQTPNNNPFSIYSTEYFPEKNWGELVNNTFIEPINFAMATEPGNTIIEGHRGSGKSMILRYLSYEAQSKRNFKERWDENYTGIYLKLKCSVTNTTTQEFFKGNKKQWIIYFMTYVNLLIGEEIIRTLEKAKENEDVTIDSEEDFVSEIIYLFFASVSSISKEKKLKNLLLMIKKMRNELAQKHFSEYDLPTDFLEQLVSSIKEYVKDWADKNFYILLDEYDNLDDAQQSVVNTLIKNRSFSYKVGVKLFEMSYEDISGKLLEKNNDYTYVSTDRFDFGPHSPLYEEFEGFARNVANKRLDAYNYKNTIDELLPHEQCEGKKGFENGDYSGFKNVVGLSSCIIRDFLELCKDMIYYSNHWIIEEGKDKLDVIIPNIQNTVIKIHSNLLYENLNKIVGYDEESKKSRSDISRLLINNLAIIFQNILRGSESKEKRTVSGFQLRNVEQLSPTAKKALKDATSYRLLQVPYNPREPQNPTRYTPHERYKFHRLLCPRFRLSLAERWPKEIGAQVFNEVFERPEETVTELTGYFIKNIPPTITKKLIDFGDE